MTTELEARAAELRKITSAPTERERAARELMEVETRLAEQRKMQEQDDVEKRMLGIKRAHPSLRDSYQQDEKRVLECTAALNAARQTMNERYVRLAELESEARGLTKTHGVPLPAFASLKSVDRVQLPAQLLAHATLTPLLDAPDYARIMRGIAEQATSAPRVEPQVPTRPRPVLTPKEEKESRRMGQAARDTERALRSIPGGQGL